MDDKEEDKDETDNLSCSQNRHGWLYRMNQCRGEKNDKEENER